MAGERRQQERRTSRSAGGTGPGGDSRLRRVRETVVWPESIVAGVAAWATGFGLTYVLIWVLGVAENADGSSFDAAAYVYFETLGGTAVPELGATVTTLVYGSWDSNFFGLAVALHGLIPVLVLVPAGYILAGRHVKSGATRRPRDTIVAGMSLVIWFSLLSVLSVVLASGEGISADPLAVLVVSAVFAGVFAAVGAGVRSRARLSSGWGILAGVGAFLLSLGLWNLLENPLDDQFLLTDSLSELDGASEYFRFLGLFLDEHGLTPAELMPEAVVAVVPMAFGAALAYVYRRPDPLVGLGEGARLGVGYLVPVFVVMVGRVGTAVSDREQEYDTWPAEEVTEVNLLVGEIPAMLFLAGVVYPVVFAAIGGAGGALVYRLQHDAADRAGTAEPADRHPEGPDQRRPVGEADTQRPLRETDDTTPSEQLDTPAGRHEQFQATSEPSPGSERTEPDTGPDEPGDTSPSAETTTDDGAEGTEKLSASDILGTDPDEDTSTDDG